MKRFSPAAVVSSRLVPTTFVVPVPQTSLALGPSTRNSILDVVACDLPTS